MATGGSLHRKLCEQPELLEHREDPELPVEQQYAPSHEVQVEEGGLLSALLPECSNFWVNSLHGQGAKVVSPRLRVEARSPDGLVEAVSVINHPFALGVQWHRNGTVASTRFRVYCSRALSPLVSTISLKNSDSDHYSLRKCKYE